MENPQYTFANLQMFGTDIAQMKSAIQEYKYEEQAGELAAALNINLFQDYRWLEIYEEMRERFTKI